jgi:hypothetical protein
MQDRNVAGKLVNRQFYYRSAGSGFSQGSETLVDIQKRVLVQNVLEVQRTHLGLFISPPFSPRRKTRGLFCEDGDPE